MRYYIITILIILLNSCTNTSFNQLSSDININVEANLNATIKVGEKINGTGSESSFFHIPGSRLSISVDGINAMDYTVYGSLGMEYAWREMAFARIGTHLGHDTAGLSLGGGVKYRGISIDYAYVNYGVLDDTHQFGIGLEF